MPEIKSYLESQAYSIDRGMESMLNNIYIQRGALEKILSENIQSDFNRLTDLMEYDEVHNASSLRKDLALSGNILVEGNYYDYTTDQQNEMNHLSELFKIQNLLQENTVFDVWSVYYSKDGYVLTYPYASIDECIGEDQEFSIKGIVIDSINQIYKENDASIIETGWQTDAFFDLTNQILMFSKNLPIKKQEEIVGIITSNMRVDDIADYISPSNLKIFTYILDDIGNVLYDNGTFSGELKDAQVLFKEIYDIKENRSETILHTNESKFSGYYFYTHKFEKTNWTLIAVANSSIVEYGILEDFTIFAVGNAVFLFLTMIIIVLLRKYHKKVKEVDTMKTEFLIKVSHDLKSPVTIIIGYLERIKATFYETALMTISSDKRDLIKEEYDKNFLVVEKEMLRLKKLINNLLEFYKFRYQKVDLLKSKIDITEILEETKAVIENEAQKKNLQVEIDIHPETPSFYADREMLFRVLINLASNALEATQQGKIMFGTRRQDDNICIEVTDTGCGIRREEQGKIFTSFNTNKKHGTGLGLSISKSIVEKHGGYISCKSELGIGSTFQVYIPIE